MKRTLISLSLLAAMSASTAHAAALQVQDEDSLRAAIDQANSDPSVHRIVFARGVQIQLTAPVVYYGVQDITLAGNGAVIDGSHAGSLVMAEDLSAVTEDGTLMFNTAGSVRIRDLSVVNSATRGIVFNVPQDAQVEEVKVKLDHVVVRDSALYGLHVDDNADAFDDGSSGSDAGIVLRITNSVFVGNGTGAIDFDGIRVDERGKGDIRASIVNTIIDGNGGDGIELDEAGPGDVDATMIQVTLNGNGFYNEADLDDGFDIDEADAGDVIVKLASVEVNNNMDEGLDFDEAGEGDVALRLVRVTAEHNMDEAIKADEEDEGDLEFRLRRVEVSGSGDDGIQFTELGEGAIRGKLNRVESTGNAKYGIKAEQWMIEDEAGPVEPAGHIRARRVMLEDNGKGDEIRVNNIVVD